MKDWKREEMAAGIERILAHAHAKRCATGDVR
jgi:hypothetical protein